jgi:hypothetical protein
LNVAINRASLCGTGARPLPEVAMSEVFLSYTSADRQDVSTLASTLHTLGVSVWFDEWMLVPGLAWQIALGEAIANSRCVAAFVGPSGTGPWQHAETMLAMDRALRDKTYRLIPVLLPDAPPTDRIELPKFLQLFTWVEFRTGLKDPVALRRLLAGIKGQPPGPPDEGTSQFIPDTNNVAPKPLGDVLINASSLAEALTTIGIPREPSYELAQWLREECVESLRRNELSRPLASFHDRLESLGLGALVKESAQQFLDDWISSLFPARLLNRAFYLSRDKVTRAYRAYKPAIAKHFGSQSIERDAPEDKFLILHQFILETGNLVFLPARFLAGQSLIWSSDPVIYFVGVFTFEPDEEFKGAFPHVLKLIADGKATIGVVNDVFDHPDPSLCRFVSLSGFIGQWPVVAAISRKYVSVNSMDVSELLELLRGMPTVIAGVASIERLNTGEMRLQPLICYFSDGQGWLHTIGAR